jgi:hypothetical protein
MAGKDRKDLKDPAGLKSGGGYDGKPWWHKLFDCTDDTGICEAPNSPAYHVRLVPLFQHHSFRFKSRLSDAACSAQSALQH